MKFDASSVVSKPLSVGDIVDFELSENNTRATRVRFLQAGPPLQPLSATRAPLKFRPPCDDKKVEKVQTMPVNYLIAEGPEGLGFSAEKWRNKRIPPTQISSTPGRIRASAPVFVPSNFMPPPPQ